MCETRPSRREPRSRRKGEMLGIFSFQSRHAVIANCWLTDILSCEVLGVSGVMMKRKMGIDSALHLKLKA